MATRNTANGRLDLSGLSVLIVEDNDDSRDMLRQIVASFGAKVVTARYGREALGVVASGRPDVVLCDLVMPGIDGFRFMEWLSGQPAERRMPVIAVTALGGARELERTRAAGFAEHLVKPVDYGTIEGALRRVLGARTS